MFPSKLPLLSILQLVAVTCAVIVALVLTHNPLALFGFALLWNPPPLVDPHQDDNCDSSQIGFVQDGEQDNRDVTMR